jgi:D-alanine-D-alanine ligase
MASHRRPPLDVLVLYNEPALQPSDPDYASEAGVLESVAAVDQALAAAGHRGRHLPVRSLEDLLRQIESCGQPDVVVNLFEGFGGVGRGEAVVAGLIELLGLPLSGSGAQCLDLVRDKAKTKWLLRGAGLPTADFELIGRHHELRETELRGLLAGGPVIVKPAHEDASLGIGPQSVVGEYAGLAAQIERVRARYGGVLVERFIAGREFNAAVIALDEPELLPLAEIEFDERRPPAERLVTYEAKWATGSADDLATRPRCPADVAPELAARISAAALGAFRATSCRHYGRVDVRVDAEQQVYILEVNGNPDIGPSAGFARALGAAGIAYSAFIDRLVNCAAIQKNYAGEHCEEI